MQKQLLIVAYGLGRDSTALLIELHRRGMRPDAITWANTGSEKMGTYQYLPVINRWLRLVGFPDVTVVQYEPVRAPYHSIEGNMVKNATLPGATFNIGSCTSKAKIEPQNKWTRHWQPAKDAWARGEKVIKMIGFEAGEEYRLKRADAKAHSGRDGAADAKKYQYEMPLIEWGYTLEKCIEIIESAGLPVPPKSACYICPNQKEDEVHHLSPDERSRIMLVELSAEPFNQKVQGLWRRRRKEDGRPGSITQYILEQGLPFTKLTDLGEQIVLNPACGKFKNGGLFTFAGPHLELTLRKMLQDAGHAVPEVVLEAVPGKTVYKEDRRVALPMTEESEIHQELIDGI